MKNIRLSLVLFSLACGLALRGSTPTAPMAPLDPGTVRSAIDLIRSDLKNQKALVIAQNITFTADEAAEFWPVYNDYNVALGKLLDERLGLLTEYVNLHDQMTNEQATALAGKILDWEGKRLELKRTWFKKFTAVVPAVKAAKFAQIENQINAALDLLLMDALPLVK
jgi:hypothetical protein